MNQKDFDDLVGQIQSQTMGLLQSKGTEYAGSTDRLANFKRNAVLSGVEPLTVLHIYMAKHWDAFSNYVREMQAGRQVALSEPITGRLADLINYAVLGWALVEEAPKTTLPRELPVLDPAQKVGDEDSEYESDYSHLLIRSSDGKTGRIEGADTVVEMLLSFSRSQPGPISYKGSLITAYRLPNQDNWVTL